MGKNTLMLQLQLQTQLQLVECNVSQVSPTTTPTLTPRQGQTADGDDNLAPVFISFSSPVVLLEPVSMHIFFCFCVCIFS